jgi:hypothetical protein
MLKESNPGVYQLNRLAGIQDASYKFDLFTIFLEVVKREPKTVFGSIFGLLILMALIIYSGYFNKEYGSGSGWSLASAKAGMYTTWPVVLFGVFYVCTYYASAKI